MKSIIFTLMALAGENNALMNDEPDYTQKKRKRDHPRKELH